MKYALILALKAGEIFTPSITTPKVIAITTGATSPLFTALRSAMDNDGAVYTDPANNSGTLSCMVVRVEDSVAVGDTLAQSNDVWHKIPVTP